MDQIPDIVGSKLVTNVFGYWPSFHDAEVVRLTLERSESVPSGAELATEVHVFEITSEVDARGSYVCRHHVLVSFRFKEVHDVRIEGFNHENAIMGLRIVDVRSRQLEAIRYEVDFAGTFGVSASFLCRDVIVESVRPWTE